MNGPNAMQNVTRGFQVLNFHFYIMKTRTKKHLRPSRFRNINTKGNH